LNFAKEGVKLVLKVEEILSAKCIKLLAQRKSLMCVVCKICKSVWVSIILERAF